MKLTKGMSVAAILAVALCGTARAAESIAKYVSPVRDVSVRSTIKDRDMDELKKISNEFAQAYRVSYTDLFYREPNKLRLVSKAGIIEVVYVINGNVKKLKAGIIRKTWDVATEPRQRQTAMTVGLLTPAYLNDFNERFLQREKIGGVSTLTFELKYKIKPQDSFVQVSVDPVKRYVVRTRQCHGDGRLKFETRFVNPVKVNGVWTPTRTEVYNPDGKFCASTQIGNITVDKGLADNLFDL